MEPAPQRPDVPVPAPSARVVELVDGAVGVLATAAGAAHRLALRSRPVVRPAVVLLEPVLPRPLRPRHVWQRLVDHGAAVRTSTSRDVLRAVDVLVPLVVAEVVKRLDLTRLVSENVDLDRVVAEVDLDGAAARLDVDAVAARLDLDAVVARVDLDAAVARVDLDAAATRLDVDEVASRLDVEAVLDRLDLTTIVLERVDLGAVVDAVLARIDLGGIAVEVIDAVDLPEIIRESTGSMASDTVRGARMQGIAADEAVARLRDRLMLRRGGRMQMPAQRDRGS